MRATSISGKLIQLCNLHWRQWSEFIQGWLFREKSGMVPCVLPHSTRLVQVPLRSFYESYSFFTESEQGREELRFFLNRVRSGDVIYDVGAFRGAYGVAAKAALAEAVVVHAFEPIQTNVEELETICQVNHFERFHIIGKAVGAGESVQGRFNRKDIMLRKGDLSEGLIHAEIEATSLDAYTERTDEIPSIIKVDVDGFELDVLRGGQLYLARYRPRLWIELHPNYLSAQGRSWEEAIVFLTQLGYRTIDFYSDYRLPTRSIAFHIWCDS